MTSLPLHTLPHAPAVNLPVEFILVTSKLSTSPCPQPLPMPYQRFVRQLDRGLIGVLSMSAVVNFDENRHGVLVSSRAG